MSLHEFYSIYQRSIELPSSCPRCGNKLELVEARYYCLDPDEGDSGGDYSESFFSCSGRCGYKERIYSSGVWQGMLGSTHSWRALSSEEIASQKLLWEQPYLAVDPVKGGER